MTLKRSNIYPQRLKRNQFSKKNNTKSSLNVTFVAPRLCFEASTLEMVKFNTWNGCLSDWLLRIFSDIKRGSVYCFSLLVASWCFRHFHRSVPRVLAFWHFWAIFARFIQRTLEISQKCKQKQIWNSRAWHFLGTRPRIPCNTCLQGNV